MLNNLVSVYPNLYTPQGTQHTIGKILDGIKQGNRIKDKIITIRQQLDK